MCANIILAVPAAAGLLAFSIPAAEAGTGGQPPPRGSRLGDARQRHASPARHVQSHAADPPARPVRRHHVRGGQLQLHQEGQQDPRPQLTWSASARAAPTRSRPGLPWWWAAPRPTTTGAAAINSIAFNGGNCANAYIGGNFTKVNGTSVTNIAEISTSTGNVVTGFAHSRQRRGGHPGRGRGPPAGGGHLHLHQRRQHPAHGQPEPVDRPERRVPEPVHRGQPGL